MTRKKTVRATRSQIVEIHRALADVLVNLSEGIVDFKDGHSDQSVADHIGVPLNSVQGLRVECFGKLVGTRRDSPEFATQLADMTERFNKLIMLLSLNKVVDCRHLEVKVTPKALL